MRKLAGEGHVPSPDAILTGLGAVANQWRDVAVAWHAVLGAMLIGLAWGWRPSHRAAGFLLSTPLMSVSIAAWGSGNRFNAVVFAGLFASLMILAKGFSQQIGFIWLRRSASCPGRCW